MAIFNSYVKLPEGRFVQMDPAENMSGLGIDVLHFSSAINACAKSLHPDRADHALQLFNEAWGAFGGAGGG